MYSARPLAPCLQLFPECKHRPERPTKPDCGAPQECDPSPQRLVDRFHLQNYHDSQPGPTDFTYRIGMVDNRMQEYLKRSSESAKKCLYQDAR